MNFLVDENMPRNLAGAIVELGFSAQDVRDIGLCGHFSSECPSCLNARLRQNPQELNDLSSDFDADEVSVDRESVQNFTTFERLKFW